jgi:hypothetical protein
MTAIALGRATPSVVLRWIVVAALPLGACYQASNARTFAGPSCPSGWRFMYSDHLQHGVVCGRDTTNTSAWPGIAPSSGK